MSFSLRVRRGDSRTIPLTLTHPYSETPFDPTGWTLIATFKADSGDGDTAAAFQKVSTIGGFTVTDAAAGEIDLALVPADFTRVDALQRYVFDIQAQNESTGEIQTVCEGTMRVDDDVTKDTSAAVDVYTAEAEPGYFSAIQIAAYAAAAAASALAAEASADEAAAAALGAGAVGAVAVLSENTETITVSIVRESGTDEVILTKPAGVTAAIAAYNAANPLFLSLAASTALADLDASLYTNRVYGISLADDSLEWWKLRALGVGEVGVAGALIISTNPARCWVRIG